MYRKLVWQIIYTVYIIQPQHCMEQQNLIRFGLISGNENGPSVCLIKVYLHWTNASFPSLNVNIKLDCLCT